MTNTQCPRLFLPLTLDAVFKLYFKKNPHLLRALLKDFLPLPQDCIIEGIELLDSEENSLKKTFILDLKLRLHRRGRPGEIVDVEMQTSTKKNFTGRLLAYAARIYSSQIQVGEDYAKLQPVYSLIFSIVNLKQFQKTKEYYHVCSLQRNCPPHLAFSQGIQFVIVELTKFSKSIEKIVDQREAWCYLLKNSGQMDYRDCEELKQKGKDMAEALKVLWGLSEEEVAQEILAAKEKQRRDRKAELDYAIEEGVKKGTKKAIKKGVKEGRQEQQREVALAMLQDGFDIEKIVKYTGFSAQEIKKLIP